MTRNKWKVWLRSDLPSKQDTPVKPAARGRQKLRKIPPCGLNEALPEEPEETDPRTTPVTQAHVKSLLPARGPVLPINPGDLHVDVLPASTSGNEPGSRASPAALPTRQTTPDPEVFLSRPKTAAKEEHKSSGTPGGIASSDTSFTCDDDDEDCDSSASSSGSSFPSPEVFRSEIIGDTGTRCVGVHIRNSTLVDASRDQSIHLHPPLDLSAIIDSSTVLAKNGEMSSKRRVEAEVQITTDLFKSGEDVKYLSPANLCKKRPFMCRKKVLFRSPILTEVFSPRRLVPFTPDPVQALSPAPQPKPGGETSRLRGMNSEEDTKHLSVPQRVPVTWSPETAKFFNFARDGDEDVFFHMMRQRSVKLRSAPLFPLTAATHTDAASAFRQLGHNI